MGCTLYTLEFDIPFIAVIPIKKCKFIIHVHIEKILSCTDNDQLCFLHTITYTNLLQPVQVHL